MDLINGWFSEISDLWPGQCMSLKVKKVLHREKSKYQDILVFESTHYGRVLVLDGVIQCTERDEFSYQEMIAHLPMTCHPDPKSILVVGGGDGGVVRELVKYPSVESITLCEIDQRVIEISKKYFPSMSSGFDHPKLDVVIGDGLEFIERCSRKFDVIITDSSDPIGPAKTIFDESYYRRLSDVLNADGIISSQGECMWLHLDLICEMRKFCQELFPVVEYAHCSIPTYPSGTIGFLLCSNNPKMVFKEPLNKLSDDTVKKMNLKYYNREMHRASFVFPQFVKDALYKKHGEDVNSDVTSPCNNGIQDVTFRNKDINQHAKLCNNDSENGAF